MCLESGCKYVLLLQHQYILLSLSLSERIVCRRKSTLITLNLLVLSDRNIYSYSPVGDTDSEAIFCALLNALKAKFETLPSLPVLHDYINKLCKEIVSANPDETILNFLLGCGRYVQFSYSWPGARPGSTVWNGLYYIVREPPFTEAHLSDMDYAVDFSEMNTDEDRVAIIATKPLTLNEEWVEIEKGELILFDQGIPHKVPEECFKIEFLGHGLDSDVMLAPKLEEDMRRYQFERSYYEGIGI